MIRQTSFCAILISTSLFSGCSIIRQHHSPPNSPVDQVTIAIPIDETEPVAPATLSDEQIMIDDILSAISQIYPPKQTTVQISANTDELTSLVADALVTSGYGLQVVRNDQGANLLSAELQTEQPGALNTSKRLLVAIGPFSISRAYNTSDSSPIKPDSAFTISGSRATIDLASTSFGFDGSSLMETEYAAPKALDTPLPMLSLITPEIVQRIVDSKVGAPEPTTVNSSSVEVSNLFYADSTFSSLFDDRELVGELIIIFPNDSIRLGNENKELIRDFMDDFVEDDEVVSLIGCSNGYTDLDIGNVGLALGRAERVAEELVGLGIVREKILDEGCWSGEWVESYPARGVVLERWKGA